MAKLTDEERLERKKAYMKEYREKNRERIAENQRKYYADNRERENARSREYYSKNLEHHAKVCREYRLRNSDRYSEIYRRYHEEHRESRNAYCRKYYKNNRDSIRERKRDYVADNLDKYAGYRQSRRALQKSAYPSVSAKVRKQIDTRFAEARVLATRLEELHGFPFHVDHIIPLALGGHHEPSNWQIISAEDNLSKGARADFTDYQWPRWLIGE